MHTLPSTYTGRCNWVMVEAALKSMVMSEQVLEFCSLQQSRGDFHKVRSGPPQEIKPFTYQRQEAVVRLKRRTVSARSRQLSPISQSSRNKKEKEYKPNSTNKSSHLCITTDAKWCQEGLMALRLVHWAHEAQETIHKEWKVQVCSHQGQKPREKLHTDMNFALMPWTILHLIKSKSQSSSIWFNRRQ